MEQDSAKVISALEAAERASIFLIELGNIYPAIAGSPLFLRAKEELSACECSLIEIAKTEELPQRKT